MPALIVLSLYGILILLYIITCFFIAYHLVNFSINSGLKVLTISVFVFLAAGLLIYNLAVFFSIDWNFLFYNLIT
ncbi:MAG: hypothetical protein ACD_15C00059G0027 [uncultured bacterium]|nr:MAG: hypothetical protein ACD_15C00059G0027 [uncultured bacterium]